MVAGEGRLGERERERERRCFELVCYIPSLNMLKIVTLLIEDKKSKQAKEGKSNKGRRER